MDQVVLRATEVTKSYAGVQALKRASLELRAGEVHALVGENGAGKSTLIKILTGAVQPDGGEITLNGEPLERLTPPPRRRSASRRSISSRRCSPSSPWRRTSRSGSSAPAGGAAWTGARDTRAPRSCSRASARGSTRRPTRAT